MLRVTIRIVALAAFLNISTFAKTQVIISEGFEETFVPENWTLVNAGSAQSWVWNAYTGWPHSGVRCMIAFKSFTNPLNTWMFGPGLNLEAGIVYRLSYWYKNQNISGQMKVTLGMANTIISQTTILHDYPSILTNYVYLQGIDEFTVPTSGAYYFAFNCYTSSTVTSGALAVDDIVLEQVTPTNCSGTPPGGLASAPQSVCASTNFSLKLNGVLTASELGFQWQSSPAGQNNFTDIAGATTLRYTLSQTVTTDYRCVVTCSNSAVQTYSNIVTVNTPSVCYCVPAASSCSAGDVITNVSLGTINNPSSCSYAGYTDNTFNVPPANFMAGSTLPISVSVGNAGTPLNNVAVWIDYDRSGTFEDNEFKLLGSGRNTTITNTVSAPITSSVGLTRMRVRVGSGGWAAWVAADECREVIASETEDYLINITPYVCSGIPSVGTIYGLTPSLICPGDSVVLVLSGIYIGLSLQWEASPEGANNFMPIAGEVSEMLRTTQSISTDYRCVVICATSGLSNVSPIRKVYTTAHCYCKTPGPCTWQYITRVTLGTLNYGSSCSSAYNDYSLAAAPTINAGSSPIIGVTIIFTGNVAVWIDLNDNGVFEPEEFRMIGTIEPPVSPGTIQTPIYIPPSAVGGPVRMRVRARAYGIFAPEDACTTPTDFIGETEDYTVNIIPLPIGIDIPVVTNTTYEPVFHITTSIRQRDVGLNISDTLGPRIFARKRSSSTWKSFKGTLVSGTATNGQWDFAVNHDSLGIRRNGNDSVVYYIVAQDLNTPFNLGYQPAAGANHSNVAIQITPPSTLLGYRVKPRLKDTVYLSATEYGSLSNDDGLFQDINARLLEGNLTVLIESDLSEKGIHSLTGVGLNGFGLVIKPASPSQYTIESNFLSDYTPGGCAIKFDNASRVTIDGSYNGMGKYLRFRLAVAGVWNTNPICQIKIWNSCDSIFLRNLIFHHASTVGSLEEHSLYISEGQNRNIHILDNEFLSMNASRQAIQFITSVSGNNAATVKRNQFANSTQAGIRLFPPANDWNIDSNHFYRTIPPGGYTYDWYAIMVTGNGHNITNNFIGGQQPYCGGDFMIFNENPASQIGGIFASNSLPGGNPVTISKNYIHNIQTGLVYAARPALFVGIHSTYSQTIIANNIIGNPANSNGAFNIVADYIYGISAYGDKPVDIRENIVTGLRNKDLPGPDYNDINIIGISWRNTANIPATVSGNRIYNIKNTRPGVGPGNSPDAVGGTVGVYCNGNTASLIKKNIIWDMSTNSGVISGLAVQGCKGDNPTVIQQNRIFNIANYSTSYTSCCGGDDLNNPIINGVCVFSDSSIDIVNNQISIDNSSFISAVNVRGIYHPNYYNQNTGPGQHVIYNTVYIGGTASQNGGSGAFVAGARPVNRAYNNIFYNERKGGTKGHFAYRFTHLSIEVPSHASANNNLYVLGNPATFAQWSPASTITWDTWKLNTGFDDTSYLLQPVDVSATHFFVDKSNGNLNINVNDESCWYANDKGLPFSFLPGDYDSAQVRSIAANGVTDLGSDEFTTNTNAPVRLCSGGTTYILSQLTGQSYQWQMDTGAGFSNISDDVHHSGSNTNILQLLNIPSGWNSYKYRCLVDGVSTNVSRINIINTWTGAVSTDWENPANWSCGKVPDENTEVLIYSQTVVINSNVTIRSIKLGHQTNLTIMGGYNLTITH